MSSHKPPPPPPRTLNVLKFAESRAPELASLHAAISARVSNDFRISNSKRRRTTGHRARGRKRQRVTGDPSAPAAGESVKKPCRRVRRQAELRANPDAGFVRSGDGTRRLRTHLWHAKRFTMGKRWGFYLPLGLHGRGRGSRAVLKWLKSGSLVHDASYCHPIQLEGSEASILAILRMVLLPSPSDASDLAQEVPTVVLGGVSYENALLYHFGTPLKKFIGPVTYMWRPSLRDDHYSSDKQVPLSTGHCISCKDVCSTLDRQLWMWIHAAAFREGFDALKFACQKQKDDSGFSVSCFSLEGCFAKLEILGTGAIQTLQRILHPVSESCAESAHSVACTDSQVQKSLFMSCAAQLPSHAILSLTVNDPRRIPSGETESVVEAPLSGPEGDLEDGPLEDPNTFASVVATKNEDFMLSMWSKPQVHGVFLSESKQLWDSSEKLKPPVPDNVMCAEKHHRRLTYLNLSEGETLDTSSDENFSQSCSVLLMKHFIQENMGTRWSVILPLSWAKVFWMCLVSHGARAIGLRERRWISCSNGLPCYPFDFPDCKAYCLYMDEEASAFDRQAERRPISLRPPRVPIPPPWNCLTSSIKKGSGVLREPETLDILKCAKVDAESSVVNPEYFVSSSASQQAGGSFQGFIMRTSSALGKYLEDICEKQLLFPNFAMENQRPFELIDCNNTNWLPNVNSLPADKGPSFVRVLLHAYKEGVFEAGAIVCAPVTTDILQWSSGSDQTWTLQIPQSCLGSYFTEQDSGKWELEVPKDSSFQQSYRWPIGFVTTGFVRGSAKFVAEAFCEAGLLTLLRGQQSNETQIRKREIFVLVRNMRSTAYRRALATIVLEQQKEDLEFM